MNEPDAGRKTKAQFAAVPVRAIGDVNLTDRDFRILAAVASHDRMSSVRGKGQGAWASHATLASEVGGGADYARFSGSMNKLVKLGYLQRGELESDARKHTYRVIYTDADCLPQRKPSDAATLCRSANQFADDSLPDSDENGEIVCRPGELSDGNHDESDAQYITQSVGRAAAKAAAYSAEAKEINLAEAALPVLKVDYASADWLNLQKIDRALELDDPVDSAGWYVYLMIDVPSGYERTRVLKALTAGMAEHELRAAREACAAESEKRKANTRRRQETSK